MSERSIRELVQGLVEAHAMVADARAVALELCRGNRRVTNGDVDCAVDAYRRRLRAEWARNNHPRASYAEYRTPAA